MEKYKSYGTLSKTTHFLSLFCEAGVVQQSTEAQAGLVKDGLNKKRTPSKETSSTLLIGIDKKQIHSSLQLIFSWLTVDI